MVDLDQLSELNGKRPFAPYWVRLVNGETVHVTEPFTAIVTRKLFFFSPDRVLMQWVPIEQVEAHGSLSDGDSGNGASDRP
ncbi:MAG: hypothetical protein WBD40_21855 [Tepidisphaeraceae bacterium]